MWFRRFTQQQQQFIKKFTRKFGGHAHHSKEFDPHVPQFYHYLGKASLIATYLWVFFSFRSNNGQILGIYKPWLHEHEHHDHQSYAEGEDEDKQPVAVEEEEGHEEEHEEEE